MVGDGTVAARSLEEPGGRLAAPRRPPIEALTGLRFVLALIVLLSHFPELLPGSLDRDALSDQGAAGVSLFFVLSGFLLMYNDGDRFRQSPWTDYRSFAAARLSRIAPVYLLSLAVLTALVVLLHVAPPAFTWPVDAVGLHAFFPTAAFHGWNPPSWSVSVELALYALFPLMAFVLLRRVRSSRASVVALILTLALQPVLFLAVVRVVAPGRPPFDEWLVLERAKFLPPLRCGEFLAGGLLAVLHRHALDKRGIDLGSRSWSRRAAEGSRVVSVCLVSVAFIGLFIASSHVDRPPSTMGGHLLASGLYTLYAPIGVVLIAAIAWESSIVSRALSRPWMVSLGRASYALYLLQWSAWLVVREVWPEATAWWPSLIALAAVLGASLAVERYFEGPSRRWLRGRLERHAAHAPARPQPHV